MNLHETGARLRTVVAALALLGALLPGAALAATPSGEPVAKAAPASALPLSGVVNLNSASSEQLQVLPGVGESRAQAIIDARKELGGFKTVDQLTEVKGIGDALMARLRPYVRTDGKTTARAN